MKDSESTFADQAPESLGRFDSTEETVDDVEQNGWSPKNWRSTHGYIEEAGSPYPAPLFHETSVENTRIRRRPCDGLSLQSPALLKFEVNHPSYFSHPYQLDRRLGLEQGLETVSGIARDEFAALDYLQPLSGLIQAARPDSRIPFIARCWDFCRGPGALIKTARLRVSGIDETIEGACICYEPPTWKLLQDIPDNFFIFRSVVGHEIGHYWWDSCAEEDLLDELVDIRKTAAEASARNEKSPANDLVEQAVSLFSIYSIMYRGYWARRAFTEDEIGAAWEKLGFESKAAARLEKKILGRFRAWDTLPVFEPRATAESLTGSQSEAEHQLSSKAVDAIRWAARDLVERATHIPFASVASIIGQRKLDTFVTFRQTAADEYPTWIVKQRRAEHLDKELHPLSMSSLWNEVMLSVPNPGNGPLSLGHRLQVARHLAHIRLHGDWAARPSALSSAADVERECSAESRDLARVLALATHVMHGETRRKALSLDLAKLLLDRDPAKLGYLIDYADRDFQWCCADPACPEAEERFLAEIHEIGRDEAHCTFWGEDGYELRASFPLERLRKAGFREEELHVDMPMKLFGVVTEDGGHELLPVPCRDEPEEPVSEASGAGRKEAGVRASEPVAV